MKQLFLYTRLLLITLASGALVSCNAFMAGYTEDKAENSYLLVTGHPKNFGDRRLQYNKGFHRNSDLSRFFNCQCREAPGFIYEYITDNKRRGIRLYYPAKDSVFIFEEPRKGNINSVLTGQRKMDGYERETYDRLKLGKR